jgi:hypothetical protein
VSKGSSSKFGTDNALRQNAVNLFYLIFLILLFTYIPSDFVDSTFHSNKSLDLISNDLDKLNKDHTVYFLHLLKSEPDLFQESKEKFIEIENLTNITSDFIDSLKLELINVDKLNDYGYFKNGRKEVTSNTIMINKKKANLLFDKLEAYKATITDYLDAEAASELEEILPLPKYEQTSDGKLKLAEAFFFDKTPLNITVLNLSHFKSRVERVKVFAHQQLIERITFDNATIIPFDDFKITEKEKIQDIYSSSTIQEFFNKIDTKQGIIISKQKQIEQLEKAKEKLENQLKKQQNKFYILSLTDSIHPAGKPIQYKADFKNNKRVSISVKYDNEIEYFSLDKPGNFYYLPKSKGRYLFTFENGLNTVTKTVTVIDIDPIIQNTKLSTLYIGIDNPLTIKTSEFDADDVLTAEITDGQIIKKGEIFYARVYKRGITQVTIYAEMPYGRVKVAEKSFVIRSLQAPTPSINGVTSGGTISKTNLKQLTALEISTDEYLIDEEVYISEFNFMLIYSNYEQVSQPIKNNGSSFNSEILSIINKANNGDVLVFSDIKTLSSRGVETTIPSLTINVL